MFVVSTVWTATLDCPRRAFASRCSMSCLVSLKVRGGGARPPWSWARAIQIVLMQPGFFARASWMSFGL
jgi:hypothetical protein